MRWIRSYANCLKLKAVYFLLVLYMSDNVLFFPQLFYQYTSLVPKLYIRIIFWQWLEFLRLCMNQQLGGLNKLLLQQCLGDVPITGLTPELRRTGICCSETQFLDILFLSKTNKYYLKNMWAFLWMVFLIFPCIVKWYGDCNFLPSTKIQEEKSLQHCLLWCMFFTMMKNSGEIVFPKNKQGQKDSQQRAESLSNENYRFVLSSKFLMSSAAE